MRELGSQSIRLICLVDLPVLGPEASSKAVCINFVFSAHSLTSWQIRLLDSFDIADLHGGLLTLCEIACAYRDFGDADQLEDRMRDVKKPHRAIHAG
jgi:hypothetical protein